MKRMFNDNTLQQRFEKDGYVVVPFINQEQVNALLMLYNEVKDEHEIVGAVHSTSDTNNPVLIRKVDEGIREITYENFGNIFFECKIFLSNFLIKETGEDSVIFPHYDWTFVDENKYASVSVWCPLTDINETNGCLSVLAGSQNIIESLRPAPDSPFAFSEVTDIMDKYMTPLTVKAGDAVIYNHAVVHASTSNLSGAPRLVTVLAVTSKEAELNFYYRHTGSGHRRIEKFMVDTEFFYDYMKNARPKGGKNLGLIEYEFKKLSRDKFLEHFENGRASKKQAGIFNRVAGFMRAKDRSK